MSKMHGTNFSVVAQETRLYRPEVHEGQIALLSGELELTTRKLLALVEDSSVKVTNEVATVIGGVAADLFSDAADSFYDELDFVSHWFLEGPESVLLMYRRLLEEVASVAVRFPSTLGLPRTIFRFKDQLEPLFNGWLQLQRKGDLEAQVFRHFSFLVEVLYEEGIFDADGAQVIGSIVKDRLETPELENSFMRLLRFRDALLQYPTEAALVSYEREALEFQRLAGIASADRELLDELWMTIVWKRETEA